MQIVQHLSSSLYIRLPLAALLYFSTVQKTSSQELEANKIAEFDCCRDRKQEMTMDTSKRAYLVAIVIQLIYTGMYVVSKAAFNHGMNTYVFIVYRQAAATVLLLPLAILLER
jgi:hypothetical protein